MLNKLLFFTHTDKNYEFFAVPYAYFALRNNPSSLVEITVDDIASFSKCYENSIELLEAIYPNRFLFRQRDDIDVKNPATLRFVQTPALKAEYVYIGDIDILVFENVFSIHKNLIEDFDLPFSNVIRPQSVLSGRPRLTGLHFCEYKKYYPLAGLDSLDYNSENDEHILYLIMKKKGLMVPGNFSIRPECGVHISLSRSPLGNCTGAQHKKKFSMGNIVGWKFNGYEKEFKLQTEEKDYQSIRPYFHRKYKLIESYLDFVVEEDSFNLHSFSSAFGVDRRLLFIGQKGEISKSQIFSDTKRALKEKDYLAAENYVTTALNLWPQASDVYKLYIQVKISSASFNNDVEKAFQSVIAIAHLKNLCGGILIKDLGIDENTFAELSKFSFDKRIKKYISE
ncbi:hypothetical protein [Salinimonas chungwhensis]|uniref:hypothetical protein n=1 Tax=Salinimonas chungwhensis TaxID=265425 RepID=UPI00036F3AA3|nr:hypothetical protein [Salinimonas chungwhensis]